jgi:hypothetical protein
MAGRAVAPRFSPFLERYDLKNGLRVAAVEFARRGERYAGLFVDMESGAVERSLLRSDVRAAEHRISED